MKIKFNMFYRFLVSASTVCVIALLLSGCVTVKEAKTKGMATLTRQHFKNKTTIADDSLEVIATISTEAGLRIPGLLGLMEDSFLRAFINKKSGVTSIQIFEHIKYRDEGWHHYYSVNYETPSGVVAANTIRINNDVSCSSGRYGNCDYLEQFAFMVDENILRSIVETYLREGRDTWKFKVKAKSGDDFTDEIAVNEVAGFLDRIDEYRQKSRR